MTAATQHAPSLDRSALDTLITARSRRQSSVGPWLLLLLIWGITTSFLIVGAETATLIAAAGG